MVDWKLTTNHLRCNESFHGHERHDHVLVQLGNSHFFAHLLHLLKVRVGKQLHALAYVKSYCRPPGSLQRKDKDFGLYRLQTRAKQYEIIPLDSIVRGALLTPDPDNPGQYFIVDTIDADMFL